LTNYRLDFSYDGTDFHGYAIQPGLRTVQGVLQEALVPVLGPIRTHVAGRTDAGVHARHQVVNVEAERHVGAGTLNRSLNRMLGPELLFESVTEVEPEFHARYAAVARTYRYFLLNRRWSDPFLARTSWHYRHPVELDRMNEAAAHVIGDHDFAAFCRKHAGKSTIRSISEAHWRAEEDDMMVFAITANAFCHQMVRSIVAMCVEIGRSNGEPGDMKELLADGDRNAAQGAAPARGLFLWRVRYPQDEGL